MFGGITVKQNKRLLALLVILMAAGLLFAQTTTSGTLKLTGAYGTGIEAKLDAPTRQRFLYWQGGKALCSVETMSK